jgi:hypothetical protein
LSIAKLFRSIEVLEVLIVTKYFNWEGYSFEFRSLLFEVSNNSEELLIVDFVVVLGRR